MRFNTFRLHSSTAMGLLLAAGVALLALFSFAPRALPSPLAGAYSDAKLHDALAGALVEYWRSETPAFPASLTTLVDYWFQWHAIKVAISVLMVIVSALLATALWQRYIRTQARYAAVAIAATVSTVAATGVLLLNIQATTVPLVALLALLPSSPADGNLAQMLSEMRDGLTTSTSPHAGSPALTVLLGEVERYFWVMVVISATLMVLTILASVLFWRRRIAADPGATRVRFVHRTLGVITALTACLLLLVAAASALSAPDPAAWLLGIIDAL